MTTLKTPTTIVEIKLLDPKTGVDWSYDYIGNTADECLTRDPEGVYDYLTDDESAQWWVHHCEQQQLADNALAGLDDDARTEILEQVAERDFNDQPALTLRLIRELV